jgi:HK97 gp10 family phage protein
MPVSLKIGGLRTMSAGLNAAIERGAKRGADLIADLARQLAPYDEEADHTHLNESIEVQPGPGSGTYTVVAGVDLPDDRAIFNEYGTENMAAAPYLTPAMEAIDIELEIRRELQALLGRTRVR